MLYETPKNRENLIREKIIKYIPSELRVLRIKEALEMPYVAINPDDEELANLLNSMESSFYLEAGETVTVNTPEVKESDIERLKVLIEKRIKKEQMFLDGLNEVWPSK